MGRIRSIRPEFPQSESIGRLSRDARLLFILTWGLADDSGRLRGNSRMLASLLFPFDEDSPNLIEGWLSELANEGLIRRYKVEGQSYIDIPKFLIHQKIDKPSPSRLPGFDEDSTRIREDSTKPQRGLATNCLGREGNGEERKGVEGDQPSELKLSPAEVSRAVRETLRLAGRDLTQALDEVCSAEMAAGRKPDELRNALCSAWSRYAGQVEYEKSPAKFFGDGTWSRPESWQHKPGKAPPAKKPLSIVERLRQEREELDRKDGRIP